MFNDEEIELTDEERAAFASLPQERALGDLLEERVVRQLRTEGMFSNQPAESRPRNRVAFFALRAAAAVTLFAGGALTERFLSSRNDDNTVAPIATRAAEQKPLPAHRSDPSKVAQLELWI
jgi:hypothetical protein